MKLTHSCRCCKWWNMFLTRVQSQFSSSDVMWHAWIILIFLNFLLCNQSNTLCVFATKFNTVWPLKPQLNIFYTCPIFGTLFDTLLWSFFQSILHTSYYILWWYLFRTYWIIIAEIVAYCYKTIYSKYFVTRVNKGRIPGWSNRPYLNNKGEQN